MLHNSIATVVFQGLLLLPGTAALGLNITINPGADVSYVTSATDGNHMTTHSPSALVAGAPTISDGGNSSTTTFTLSDTSFDFIFAHMRGTVVFNSGGISFSEIYFSPDQNADYALSGQYSSVDSQGLFTLLNVSLLDVTSDPSQILFSNIQQSESTPDESFALGSMGGDSGNGLSGSLTGTLIAGHEYRLETQAMIVGFPSAATVPATATGNVTLTFTPEPSTTLLLASGLLGLGSIRRRSQHQTAAA